MNHLQDFLLFSDLSTSDQEILSSFCQEKYLSDGEVLFEEGEEAQAMYLILQGSCAIMKWWEQCATLSSWDILGEIAFLFQDQKRNASAVSLWPTKLLVIISFSMNQMFEKYPKLHAKMRKIIEERVRV